jgi:tyrosyl-tRNA synthetase
VATPKVVEENGVLAFVEYVLLPAAALRGERKFIVERERDGLEPLVYSTIQQMHDDYRNDVVRLVDSTCQFSCDVQMLTN